MNKPIRTHVRSSACCCSRRCCSTAPTCSTSTPTASTRAATTSGCATRSSPASAARSSSAARRSPRACQANDQYKYQRRYTQPPQVRPAHRLLLLHLRPLRAWSRARTRSSPAATPGCSSTGSSTWSATASPRAARSSLTIDPKAQTAAYDGLRALGKNVAGRGRRARPDDRQGPRDGHARRPTTPTGWPRTSSARCRRPRSELNSDQEPAAAQPGDPGDLPARARRSSWSPRRRRCRAGSTPRTPRSRAAPRSTCRRPSTDLLNENGSDCGGDPITLTQALEVSCNVSFGDIGLRLGDDALREQAEKFGFDQTYLNDLDGQVESRFPERPRRAADRAVGDRPVRRAPPPRCRWRWSPPASPTAAR